ncbi:glycosyltransferase family 8 protein [Caballeronia grimmiae]|uniref:glycosyltransferase family 8 protein n=1 Tax=Caballeronia grimmiae TaxID=1071679 RepID=UPI0038B71BF7
MPSLATVVYCFDKNYAPYAAVSIFTLASSNKSTAFQFVCLVPEEDHANVIPIMTALEKKTGLSITLQAVRMDDFSGWWINAHLSISTYLRLLIPTLINEPRALYVDADTLVLSSLESLFSMDLKNCLLAGTPDVLGGQISKIPRSSEDTYLNAGVLLMDLDALRQDGMLDKAMTIYRAYQHQLVMYDQCLINKYAEGRKLVLDSKWNRLLAASTVTDVQFKQLLTNENPAILHFVSHYKPWQRWCTPAVAEFWWHHADQAGIDELKPTEITSIDQSIMFSRILDANARYEEASERKEAIIQELISLVHQHRSESAEALSRSNQFMEELMSLTNRYQFSS